MSKTLVSVSLAALALAGAAWAGPGLPAGWTHAEVNVFQNHAAHTIVFDRGHVTAVSPTSLTLREADGSSVEVGLDPTTQVKVNGRPGQLADIRRGAFARTERIDGGSARQVIVRLPRRLARR